MSSEQTNKRKSGYMVMTQNGTLGRTYHNDEIPAKGKVFVHVLNNNFKETGEKVIVSPESLTVKGFID